MRRDRIRVGDEGHRESVCNRGEVQTCQTNVRVSKGVVTLYFYLQVFVSFSSLSIEIWLYLIMIA